ncbi:MAG: ABC transporter permease [Spirochaetales bacterium]|nr:ABC transporter permease [Spirochaetales bacterium]
MDYKEDDELLKKENAAEEFVYDEEAAEDYEANQVFMTPGQMVFRRFMRNRLAVVGICAIVFMFLFCFVGPFFSPYSETELFYKTDIDEHPDAELIYYRTKAVQRGDMKFTVYYDMHTGEECDTVPTNIILDTRAKPSKDHILGTTEMGQDMFTRLMYGGRISLMLGFVVVFVELLIGVTMGGIAGYYGGKVDMIIMRMVEIFQSIPFIPLMLIISSLLISFKVSPRDKIYYTMFIMGVIYWAGVARMVRGSVLSVREQEYMQAAEATGIRTSRKIFKHMIPNIMPIIIVMATMDLGGVILMESTMSYLGIGVGAPYASWGNMVSSVNNAIVMRNCPYLWIPPGICILITVMAFNFIGDGLRDAFDPKMKR